jgi:hypothetical protein
LFYAKSLWVRYEDISQAHQVARSNYEHPDDVNLDEHNEDIRDQGSYSKLLCKEGKMMEKLSRPTAVVDENGFRSFGPVTLSYYTRRDKNDVGIGAPVVKTICPAQKLKIVGDEIVERTGCVIGG